MRAKESLVQLGLAGLGKFVVMTSAFCLAMTVAISGPPTPSETAGVRSALTHAIRRVDSAALNLNFDLCRRAAVIAHAAGLCAAPATVVMRKDTPQPIEVATVSQTLPPSAREILPPDTLDQIEQSSRRADLLGAAPPEPRHVTRAAHTQRAVSRARASPPHNRAIASSRARTQHATARVRRAPSTPTVRAAAARSHTARPTHRAPVSSTRTAVRTAPRVPSVAAPALEHPRPHDERPPETTLDQQLEHITAPSDDTRGEPDGDTPPPDEKS